ncbi:hypothetical protein G6F35_011994 [Rhizopus arrhizus]|nr:hypothetical protein G6F35_011994 [Rhizopus arrhizus]
MGGGRILFIQRRCLAGGQGQHGRQQQGGERTGANRERHHDSGRGCEDPSIAANRPSRVCLALSTGSPRRTRDTQRMPTPSTPEQQAARAAGLRYVDDTQPGIGRRRAGKGFSYRDADGHAVRDAATLHRIRALAIPPAYTAVWICAHANGHLQATGRDARGRKQYRYHADWAKERDAGKFDRIIAFGEAIPSLRRRLSRDLKRPGFPREKVLAMVVALLADTLVRAGNETYAQQNRSFGLTTLRNRHLELLRGGRVRMRFRGKSGQLQEVTVGDRRLGLLVRRLQQLPGQALFQYRDDDGALQPVDSGAVNDYLREVMGEDFTAKDFRT